MTVRDSVGAITGYEMHPYWLATALDDSVEARNLGSTLAVPTHPHQLIGEIERVLSAEVALERLEEFVREVEYASNRVSAIEMLIPRNQIVQQLPSKIELSWLQPYLYT